MAQADTSILHDAIKDENKNNEKHEFSVGCFNVWCPRWNGNESNHPQIWKKRHNDILNLLCNNDKYTNNCNENENKEKEKEKQLESMNCDIYCLQEFWCDREPFVRMYENYFKARNYSLHFLTRNSKYKPDGIAILINNKTFKLINKINYKYTISNRVVLLVELLHLKSNVILNIANTHLTFPQNYYDHQLRDEQVKQFLDVLAKNTSQSVSNIMACGDFNCEIDGNECVQCLKQGYESSFHIANAKLINKGKFVSHFNHENESVFVDHIFYKKNPNVLEQHSCTITPLDSYIYPRDMKCDKWNDKWKLSDHRPLVSTFAIKHD